MFPSVSWIPHGVYFQSHFGLNLRSCSFTSQFPSLVRMCLCRGTKPLTHIIHLGCAVRKHAGGSGNGTKSKALPIPNLPALCHFLSSCRARSEMIGGDGSILLGREKSVQGWSTLLWLSECVKLTPGTGEDVFVPSDVLLTQKLDWFFFFLPISPCSLLTLSCTLQQLCPVLWETPCSVCMWDECSCPITCVGSPSEYKKTGGTSFNQNN